MLGILRRPEVMAHLADWGAGSALGDDTRDRVRASSGARRGDRDGHGLRTTRAADRRWRRCGSPHSARARRAAGVAGVPVRAHPRNCGAVSSSPTSWRRWQSDFRGWSAPADDASLILVWRRSAVRHQCGAAADATVFGSAFELTFATVCAVSRTLDEVVTAVAPNSWRRTTTRRPQQRTGALGPGRVSRCRHQLPAAQRPRPSTPPNSSRSGRPGVHPGPRPARGRVLRRRGPGVRGGRAPQDPW